MKQQDVMESLIELSHELGREDRGWAILGEGNTSAKIDDETFLVKASGSYLSTIDEGGFSAVRLQPVLDLLDADDVDDAGVKQGLSDALVDSGGKRPSVETFLHALCLTEGGASWVGHTHTESVLKILCSRLGAAPFQKPLYPDQIVICGRDVAVLPYVDPGLTLARAVRKVLREFRESFGTTPKLLLMENHGPVALGQSAKEVLNIHYTLDKWANVLLGNIACGGIQHLTEEQADRIESRPDEHYRRQMLSTS